MESNNSIEIVESIMNICCPEILKGMQPGLDYEKIDTLVADKDLNINPIRDLYQWRNGYSDAIRPNGFIYSFHSCGNFLPLEDAVQTKKEIEEEGHWDFRFFPIMTNYNSDYLLIDLEENSPSYGMLFFSSFSLHINPPISIYDSFPLFVESLAQTYAMQGYIYRRRIHELEIKDQTEQMLGGLINPRSEYWK